ncbi:uncharacterized protein TNIN_496201 [Trichonephila inaurata madagascariensis]|uniref:Uncharacterized protein n=1 Tax=Trichonephila inaurata madagascariensis TaxID=2747483 RepID=A0A8X6WLD5_9ARAC|nr:uncharacterized protein TNIN_496201 [Trichonephila inaurata madagascariensis]
MACSGIAQSQEESFDPPGGPGRFGGPQGGFGGPPGRPRAFGGSPRGPDGQGGPKHGPSVLELFPACKPMADAMRDKHRELMQDGKIGPRNCQQQDRRACMQNDMKIVRCAITETPSTECMDQLNAFMQRDMCSGPNDDSTTENGVNST